MVCLCIYFQSYNVSVKDFPAMELDNHGCSLHCSALCDPSQDNQLIVAGDDCVYLYQPDERGPCFAFEGQKQIVHWYRGYLIIVSKDKKSSKYASSFVFILGVIVGLDTFLKI